jgi:hypothetical protein
MNQNSSCVVRVQRKRSLCNYNSGLSIFIDNFKVGTLENGETREFTAQPGKHSIYAKLWFYTSKSLVFDLSSNNSIDIICSVGRNIASWLSSINPLSEDYIYIAIADSEGISIQPISAKTPQSNEIIVHLQSELERVKAATEEVLVPDGVTITVKRSRTVEHTIEISWNKLGAANVDIGFKQLLSASVRGEVQRSQGNSFQESETVEYEIELNGHKYNRYQLTWTDIWRKGVVELREQSSTRFLPFQFKERAELSVVPMSE